MSPATTSSATTSPASSGDAGAFRSRTATVLVVICVVSFLGLGLLMVFGPEFSPTRSGRSDVFSTSAVGHGALYDLLDRLDIPVMIHRSAKHPPLGDKGVLLVLEPHLHLQGDTGDLPGLAQLVAAAPAVLLALPKWQVLVDEREQARVTAFAPWPDDWVLGPLRTLEIEAELLRLQVEPEGTLRPSRYDEDPAHETRFRQYLASDQLEPLMGTPEAMLLGRLEYEGVPVYVLADPDLLQNHGLHRDPNATLVVSWIEELRQGGPVAFDETLHGFPPRDESLVRELFRFPLVLVLLHLIFGVGLVLWAGLSGFGDAPAQAPEVEPGSGFLIRHTAYLLRFTRHREMALRRYVLDTSRQVALRYRLPADLKGPALDGHLDQLGARRGVTTTWSQLKHRALTSGSRSGSGSRAGTLRAAHDLYEWKQEILDGTRSDSRNTQPVA